MELIRKIIVPKGPFCVVELPSDMIGKQIEIIVFELKQDQIEIEKEKARRLEEIDNLFKDLRVDLSNFKFDRDEANNYDD